MRVYNDLKINIELGCKKSYDELYLEVVEAYSKGEIDSQEYLELYEMISKAKKEAKPE